MLNQLETYLLEHWQHLPGARAKPRRISFLGQATGVSKACFFVFADQASAPCYIVKTTRSPTYNLHLLREAALIASLRRRVPKEIQETLPGPMHLAQMAGQVVVIEPFIHGEPLDVLSSERQLHLAYKWLVDMQRTAGMDNRPLDSETIWRHMSAPIEQMIEHTDLLPAERRYIDRLWHEARGLLGRRLPLCLYHGDFRAGNLLANGDQVTVLDWEFSQPLALPLLDWLSFAFRVYSKHVQLPDIDGTLEHYRAAFRAVFFERNSFSNLVASYSRAYCAALDIDPAYLSFLFGMFVITNINKFSVFLTQRSQRTYLYLLRGAGEAEQPFQHQLRRQAYVYFINELAANGDALTLVHTPSRSA